jgi:hypothetical protein
VSKCYGCTVERIIIIISIVSSKDHHVISVLLQSIQQTPLDKLASHHVYLPIPDPHPQKALNISTVPHVQFHSAPSLLVEQNKVGITAHALLDSTATSLKLGISEPWEFCT